MSSKCQVRKIQFDEQTISFLLNCDQRIYNSERHKNQLKIVLEMSFLLTGIAQEKSISESIYTKQLIRTVANVHYNIDGMNIKGKTKLERNY